MSTSAANKTWKAMKASRTCKFCEHHTGDHVDFLGAGKLYRDCKVKAKLLKHKPTFRTCLTSEQNTCKSWELSVNDE